MTRSERIKLAKHGIAIELGLIDWPHTARYISENVSGLGEEEIDELEIEMKNQADSLAAKLVQLDCV